MASFNGRVRIVDYDDLGNETARCEAWLDDVLERDDPEHGAADRELRDTGRFWIGGGAAPLVLLIAV